MKSIKWLVVVFIVGLTFYGAQGVLVQAQVPDPIRSAFVGTVSSFDGDLLVLEREGVTGSESVEIVVTEDTTILAAAQPVITGPTEALEVGANVTVLAQEVDGGLEAIYIGIKPEVPQFSSHVGAVVSIEDGVLTIVRPDGTTKVIDLHSGSEAPPLGELVTVVAQLRVRAAEDEPPVMTGLMTAVQTRTRLESSLQQLADGTGDFAPAILQDRTRLVTQLATRLEEHTRLQTQALQQVCDNVCDNPNLAIQAREQIKTALENAQRVQAEAVVKAQEARAKAGVPETPPVSPGRPQDGQQPADPGGQNSGGGQGGRG